MRRIYPFILAVAATCGTIDADVITQWTFETSAPSLSNSATISGIAAEVGTGTASGEHASAATDWSNPAGNGSAESFSSNNWSIGDSYLFQTATTGFSDITFSFDHMRSATGPGSVGVFFSTDGVIFTALTLSESVGSSYGTFSSPTIPGIDDLGLVFFSIQSAAVPSSTAGTLRVDNVTVSGNIATPVPEPSTFVGVGLLAGLGFWARRRKTV